MHHRVNCVEMLLFCNGDRHHYGIITNALQKRELIHRIYSHLCNAFEFFYNTLIFSRNFL